jgi:hypothetical protein
MLGFVVMLFLLPLIFVMTSVVGYPEICFIKGYLRILGCLTILALFIKRDERLFWRKIKTLTMLDGMIHKNVHFVPCYKIFSQANKTCEFFL